MGSMASSTCQSTPTSPQALQREAHSLPVRAKPTPVTREAHSSQKPTTTPAYHIAQPGQARPQAAAQPKRTLTQPNPGRGATSAQRPAHSNVAPFRGCYVRRGQPGISKPPPLILPGDSSRAALAALRCSRSSLLLLSLLSLPSSPVPVPHPSPIIHSHSQVVSTS
ncbi:hypothetical protein G7Z17_g12024 [Cylindrodendrum hubeiense]|uniref:Uncharacterized protein n=1 Tax=Cylindrodendrum hubeiense TaxID=595255 RepID=A0A9P5GYF6_9HYPO|nr:hypothetical protein G7Z17_g12024 [Cylindrodendrum hubeiense]